MDLAGKKCEKYWVNKANCSVCEDEEKADTDLGDGMLKSGDRLGRTV